MGTNYSLLVTCSFLTIFSVVYPGDCLDDARNQTDEKALSFFKKKFDSVVDEDELAEIFNSYKIHSFFESRPAREQQYALLSCAQDGLIKSLSYLLEKKAHQSTGHHEYEGADCIVFMALRAAVLGRDFNKDTSDHIKCIKAIIEVAEADKIDILHILQSSFYNHKNLLMIAASLGRPNCLKVLLDCGADPCVKNDGGYSALDYAVVTCNDQYKKDYTQCMIALVDRIFIKYSITVYRDYIGAALRHNKSAEHAIKLSSDWIEQLLISYMEYHPGGLRAAWAQAVSRAIPLVSSPESQHPKPKRFRRLPKPSLEADKRTPQSLGPRTVVVSKQVAPVRIGALGQGTIMLDFIDALLHTPEAQPLLDDILKNFTKFAEGESGAAGAGGGGSGAGGGSHYRMYTDDDIVAFINDFHNGEIPVIDQARLTQQQKERLQEFGVLRL